MRDLIYGKDKTEGLVSIEPTEDGLVLHFVDGRTETVPTSYWILYTKELNPKFKRLEGDLAYKYIMEYDSLEKYEEIRKHSRQKRYVHYSARSPVESAMIRHGYTLYKGLKVEDVSVLSFDIETSGLTHDADSKVFLISNTIRYRDGQIDKKLFSLDEYSSEKVMLDTWCAWVRSTEAAILTGHNILGYDLPYLEHVASMNDTSLKLGTDKSAATFNSYASKFPGKNGQMFEFNDCKIFGRQIVDTFFLSMKHDIGSKYPSYGLKAIVKHEGLEKEGRQHYDAGSIRDNWYDENEREKIKAYAIDDADDSLALFDLMIAPFFYFTQSLPMGLQDAVNRGTGTQINSLMMRSYVQEGHSVPVATETGDYVGAISYGNPGIYRNCYKVDVASLYPSIILQYGIYDKQKDPKKNFLNLVDFFTKERLENKRLGKETGERYYKDLEQSQKIVINSAYGFLGTKGLAFNAPDLAAKVTDKGQGILQQGIEWATGSRLVKVPVNGSKEFDWAVGPKVSEGKGYTLVNCDTDSFMYTGPKHKKGEFEAEIVELNTIFDSGIRWEDDGYYKRVLVVKTKNYILDDGKKITTKGSALKATMKEPALKRMIDEITDVLLANKKDHVFSIYNKYVLEALNVTDISDWCSKKTYTDAVENSERTNESRIRDALNETDVSKGDKVFVFFESKEKLTVREEFTGVYCRKTLVSKLYNTLKVFENVIDIEVFPNYSLKRNEGLLSYKETA